MITSGPEAVEPGKAWIATLELNEFPRQPHPRVVASRGDRRVTAQLRRVPASMVGAAGFKLRMVFPSEGRWRLAVVAEKRRFPFPAVAVGSGAAPQDYVSFPKGSEAARQGAGGVWSQGPEADSEGRGTPLPPEVVAAAGAAAATTEAWRSGFPALGLALAGAGAGARRGASPLGRRPARGGPPRPTPGRRSSSTRSTSPCLRDHHREAQLPAREALRQFEQQAHADAVDVARVRQVDHQPEVVVANRAQELLAQHARLA